MAAHATGAQTHGARSGLQGKNVAVRAIVVAHRGEARGRAAHHQGLPARGEHVERAVFLRHRGHAGQLGYLVDQAIALIKDVRRGIAQARATDFNVEARNFSRQAIDLFGTTRQPRINFVVDLFQALLQQVKARNQRLRATQQFSASGLRCRLRSHALRSVEKR